MYPNWDFYSHVSGRIGEEMERKKPEKGSEEWKEDDRGAEWSKSTPSPPAMPSVRVRPNPFGVLTPLMRDQPAPNASCLCVSLSHCMSEVHLFCIKVSGKDAMGISRFGLFLIKRLPSNEDSGAHGYGLWLHILMRQWLCLHSWLARHTRVSLKAHAKQTTPINLMPLDASLCEVNSTRHRRCLKSLLLGIAASHVTALTWKQTEGNAI